MITNSLIENSPNDIDNQFKEHDFRKDSSYSYLSTVGSITSLEEDNDRQIETKFILNQSLVSEIQTCDHSINRLRSYKSLVITNLPPEYSPVQIPPPSARLVPKVAQLARENQAIAISKVRKFSEVFSADFWLQDHRDKLGQKLKRRKLC